MQTAGEAVLRVRDDQAIDLVTGAAVVPLPESRDDVVLNNRVRRELATAIATLKLAAPDRAVRFAAAQGLQSGADENTLPAIERALAKEQDPEIKALLTLTHATVQLGSADKPIRLAAIRALAESRDPATKTLLLPLVEKKGGEFVEPDGELRAAAELSLRAIESRLATGEMVGRVFSGVSLGSVLLLAALGLAITYGLMGVINMAHGELMMIGAYATYVDPEPVPQPPARRVRLVSRRGDSGRVRGRRAGRDGARAQRDPLPLRPAAGDAAGDLGHQPDPDPADAHALRRAERPGRESGVDVGRHRTSSRTWCCRGTASSSSASPPRWWR